MTTLLISVLREALWLLVLAAAPPLLAAALAGALADLLQGQFALREPTTAALLRLAGGLVVLVLCGPWIGQQLVRFFWSLLQIMPHLGRW
ncbi:MAG: flagellar biosynthetic protein FliQ [Myxococcales bacterium]|nr:flagellar biosynthetic protein FliQ [Myxococcota bacterium]MDW8281567.1 flagellar biosynthetic protein FliQ [Myxococcales bacterium]